MDGLFTVFGLGTAFGFFCSWVYDIIRKRNLPVARGASFEAFHGKDVMPAPEPISTERVSKPVSTSDVVDTMTMIKSDTKPTTSVTPSTPLLVVTDSETATTASINEDIMGLSKKQLSTVEWMNRTTAEARALGARPASKYALDKAAAEVGHPGSQHEMLGSAVSPQSAGVKASYAGNAGEQQHSLVDMLVPASEWVVKNTSDVTFTPSKYVAPIATSGALDATRSNTALSNKVERTMLPHETKEMFSVSDVPFSDTVSFDSMELELPSADTAWVPSKPGTPRVVLLVNNNLVREVQENDFPRLMQEFGILADSEQAKIFQGGESVTVGHTTLRLAQV